MQHEAGGAGRQSPAQALLGLSASSQDKPGTGVSLLGKDEDGKGATLLGYPHPAPLHSPISMPGCTGDTQQPRDPGDGRAGLCPSASRPNTCSLGTLPSPWGCAGRQSRMEPKKQLAAEPEHCILPRARGRV